MFVREAFKIFIEGLKIHVAGGKILPESVMKFLCNSLPFPLFSLDDGTDRFLFSFSLFGDIECDDQSLALSRSEEHTSELQSRGHLVCRLLLEKKNNHQKTKLCCQQYSLI